MTLNLFYQKSMVFVVPQILLAFYSGFSATTSFDTILLSIFNCSMTSVGCLVYGLFERHIKSEILLAKPHLYKAASRQANLDVWYVSLWILDGLWQGIVIFYASHFILAGGEYFGEAVFHTPGLAYKHLFDFSLYGCATYLFTWLAVNLRYVILVKDYSEAVLISLAIIFGLNGAIFFALETTTERNNINFYSYSKLMRSPTFWIALPWVLICTNLPSFVWRIMSDIWWTNQIETSSDDLDTEFENVKEIES